MELTFMIHKCPYCKLTYNSREFLIEHIEQHKKKIFSCSICGVNYKQKKHYKRHILAKHSQDNKISCKDCGKQYSRKEHLIRHACDKKTETEKLFSCRTCGKAFHRKDLMQKHEKIH